MRIHLAAACRAAILAFKAEFAGNDAPAAPAASTEPAPTFDELVFAIHRFTHERAPLFPGESVALAMYVATFAEACAPALARFRAAFAPPPPPEPPSEDDAVN
jgi:hypothetical protein